MAAKQGVILKSAKQKNNDAKYKLKYTYALNSNSENGIATVKYTYSKIIYSLSTKKYSYST